MKIDLILFIVFIHYSLHINCKPNLKTHKFITNQLISNRILQIESKSGMTNRELLGIIQNVQIQSIQNQSIQNLSMLNQSIQNQSNILNKAINSLKNQTSQLINQSNLIIPSQPGNNISFIFVGDIMMSRTVGNYLANNKNNDMTFPFQLVKSILANYDIRVANLESGITNNTTPLKKIIPCSISNSGCCDMKCFFKVSPNILNGIIDYAGFNLLTIENNHIDDYVNERQDTINAIKNHKTAFIDFFHPLNLTNFKGCNIEFYAYNFINPLFSFATLKTYMQNQLRHARNDSFKIYYLHGGKEYDIMPTPNQTDFAHATIDAGADMIIFSHTHVIGQHEIYNNKHIIYGLGNFVFDQNAPLTKNFYTLTFDLQNCKDVMNFKILNGTINSVYQPNIQVN